MFFKKGRKSSWKERKRSDGWYYRHKSEEAQTRLGGGSSQGVVAPNERSAVEGVDERERESQVVEAGKGFKSQSLGRRLRHSNSRV